MYLLMYDTLDVFYICLYFVFRVTVVKDRVTRESKGIAFVLFLTPEDALKCVEEFNGTEV